MKLYKPNHREFQESAYTDYLPATLEDLKQAAAELGYALVPTDERLREKQADEAIASMVRLSKRIENSDWYKAEGEVTKSVSVPREPTEKMISAGWPMARQNLYPADRVACRVYKAMIEAAEKE